jgi:hypothetical protein
MRINKVLTVRLSDSEFLTLALELDLEFHMCISQFI